MAHLPPEAGQATDDTRLKVNLVLAHYHLGLPFKRIESFQDMVGMPLPDATQWVLIEQVADTGLNTIIYGETGVGKELVVQCLYR